MTATNIEQSKHLLELGLDTKTADMVWRYVTSGCYRLEVLHKELFEATNEKDIPAWSLSALLDVIPKECEPDLQKSPISGVYFAHYFVDGKPYITDIHGDAVEAAYQMVCWLLRQGYIKKGGEQ